MNVGDYLGRIEEFPLVPLERIVGRAPILVLSPHPDDETLGCGGLLAAAQDRGLAVQVVILTDGAGSHPRSLAFPPARLKALRKQETRDAVAALGLPATCVTFLDVADTEAPLGGPVFDDVVDQLCRHIDALEARSLFVTWRHDPHCDHEAAALMADAVVARIPGLKLWHYPIWGLHLDPNAELAGTSPTGVRFDIKAMQARKNTAIACYASQMTGMIADDPDGFRFTDQTLAPFLKPYERFIEIAP